MQKDRNRQRTRAFAIITMDLFTIIPEHQMLLCRMCGNAVRPSGIESHFRSHKISGQELRDVIDYTGAMELNDPLTVELLANGSTPVEGERVLFGFSCTQCRFFTIARDNITRHWRTASHATEQGSRWTNVKLQS